MGSRILMGSSNLRDSMTLRFLKHQSTGAHLLFLERRVPSSVQACSDYCFRFSVVWT